MPKKINREFAVLSSTERVVVGTSDDYAWEKAIELPARPRTASVQFSIRVDREVVDALQRLSRERSGTFSETVREALERFVKSGGRPALSNVQVTFGRDYQMLVQVAGGRAEVPTNRRSRDPNERSSLRETGAPALTF